VRETQVQADGGNTPAFAAVDVHYPASGGARAALVLAGDRAFSEITAQQTVFVPQAAPYVPGQFFRRELPPLRAVLAGITGIELLVIDGYVDLAPDGRPGLGAYVHREFGVPVIGVAKTPFAAATHAIPVPRGQATRPLYVTAAGISVADAAAIVREMSGKFRMPDALRRVDALARGRSQPLPSQQASKVDRFLLRRPRAAHPASSTRPKVSWIPAAPSGVIRSARFPGRCSTQPAARAWSRSARPTCPARWWRVSVQSTQ
jgi:deoxyribonuclease V